MQIFRNMLAQGVAPEHLIVLVKNHITALCKIINDLPAVREHNAQRVDADIAEIKAAVADHEAFIEELRGMAG